MPANEGGPASHEPAGVILRERALHDTPTSVMCQRLQCNPCEETTSGLVARFHVGIDLMHDKAGQADLDFLWL